MKFGGIWVSLQCRSVAFRCCVVIAALLMRYSQAYNCGQQAGAQFECALIGGDGVLEPFENLRLLGFSEPYFGVFRQPLTGGFKRYERRFLPITSALRKAEIEGDFSVFQGQSFGRPENLWRLSGSPIAIKTEPMLLLILRLKGSIASAACCIKFSASAWFPSWCAANPRRCMAPAFLGSCDRFTINTYRELKIARLMSATRFVDQCFLGFGMSVSMYQFTRSLSLCGDVHNIAKEKSRPEFRPALKPVNG